MERLTEKRKREYLDLYGDSVRPITKAQTEWCLKDTARYIWFTNKDAINGHCDRCGNDVTMKMKTKHHERAKCPKCRKELEIRHDWRVKNTYHTNWRAVINVLRESDVLIRYILITQHDRERTVQEVSREVLNFDAEVRRQFETSGWDGEGEWRIGNKHQWFTERTMNCMYRSLCCLQADFCMLGLNKELKKCNRFKYIDKPSDYFSNKYYVTSMISRFGRKANVYEKLEKVGLKELAIEEYQNHMNMWSYRDDDLFDTEQTSLVKMLRLDKGSYKRFMERRTIKALGYLQNYPHIKDDVLDYVLAKNINISAYREIKDLNVGHEYKMLTYTMENNISMYEYKHYVGLLKELEYKLDKAYLFPKDFRKADDKITKEYQKNKSKIEAKKMRKQDGLIKAISDGLRKMDDLQDFLNGSDGLLVYVPESTKDLETEGRELHNCIGTYAKRIAEGKTLVFFVRRLNAPDAPFVAFEYVNGDVVQCRYDHNQNVEDDKIINFVDAFAERLRKNKVLYKAA